MSYAEEIVLFHLVCISQCTEGIRAAWTRGMSLREVYFYYADRSRHNLLLEEFLTGPSLFGGVVEVNAMPTEIPVVGKW